MEETMAQAQTYDVAQLIDDRGISKFNIQLVLFTFLVVLFDGYDIAAMAFAAPSLIRAWGVGQADLAPVFGASLIGMLFGAPLLGYVGDRFGRKRAIILSCLIFGVFTWLSVLATGLHQLFWLRLLAGIGIGGLLPNAISLTAEFAPRRYRATLIILMFSGVSFGGVLPGAVAALLVPAHGWQILFTVGGVIPIVVAIICAVALPESIKYLVVKGRTADTARLMASVRPDQTFAADAQFTIRDEKQYSGLSPKHLFGDGLGAITPLLWVLFVMNLMGYFALLSWTPVLLTSANIPLNKAAAAQMVFQLGGTIGGWVLCRPMDKQGLAPVTILFALAVPAVAVIGYIGTISETLLLIVEFFAGFCVLGLQFGLNAVSGVIYPTSFRANGSGWALGIGRVGAIVGPLLGGLFISMHLPIQQLFLLAAIPFVIGTIACYYLARLYVIRFQGSGLGQRDTLDHAAAE
jgi:AAHS family 4-hydroxybenzoate transporter-like MFS transporter